MYQFPLHKIKPDLQTRGQKKGLFLGRDPSKQLNGQKNVRFSGRGALAPKKGGAEAVICMYIGRLESKLSSDLYTYKNRMTFVIRPFNLRRVRDKDYY